MTGAPLDTNPYFGLGGFNWDGAAYRQQALLSYIKPASITGMWKTSYPAYPDGAPWGPMGPGGALGYSNIYWFRGSYFSPGVVYGVLGTIDFYLCDSMSERAAGLGVIRLFNVCEPTGVA